MKHTKFFALALALALAAQAEVFIYDFGTKDSPLYPGAIRVTEANSDRASWCLDWAKSTANPIVREWPEDKRTGKKNPPPSYLNSLTCDYVSCGSTLALTLKGVPSGAYKLLLLCGRAGGRPEQVWDIEVSAGTNTACATFAGAHELRPLQFDAASESDTLELAFYTSSR